MTDAELDAIKTAEDMRAWHELNKEDPHAVEAVAYLRKAVQVLEEVEAYLQNAAEAVEDTPETDRIASLNMAAEELEIDVRQQIGRMV